MKAVVVGGGAIGAASALALGLAGVETTLLERSTERVEMPGTSGVASWAAAGILGAQIASTTDGPLFRLGLAGRDRYPAWVERIQRLTGMDVELRDAGVARVAYDSAALAAIDHEVAWQTGAGVRVERLDAAAVRALEPSLSPDVAGALRFPDDPRIDPPKLLAATRMAAQRAGVTCRYGARVLRVTAPGGAARGVEFDDGSLLEADVVVIAAGPWSPFIDGWPLASDAVHPARGQILELALPQQILRGVVEGPDCYLSPRDDGRILVGSTVELVGFDFGPTAGTARDLLAAAVRLMPALAEANFGRAWGGLRPRTADELPAIGPTPVPGLLVATGHFRNGLLQAPITAEIILALVTGAPLPFDIAPFDPARLR